MDEESQCRAGIGIKCKEDLAIQSVSLNGSLLNKEGRLVVPQVLLPPPGPPIMKWVPSALRKEAGLLISPPSSHDNEFIPLPFPGGMGASREDSETDPNRR